MFCMLVAYKSRLRMRTLVKISCLALVTLLSIVYTTAQNMLPDTGRVGIGILEPEADLHIKSEDGAMLRLQSTKDYGYVQLANIEGQKGYLGIFHHKDDVEFGTNNFNPTGRVHLITKGRPKLTVDENGLVGIGTDTPEHNLHVLGSNIRLESLSDPEHYLDFGTTGTSFGIESNGRDLYIGSNTGNTLIQTFGGGVGIGTKSVPTGFSLALGGKAIIEELHVDMKENWPDYVFTPAYNRLSIEEVYAFIQCNGHLPWFAPAKEVETKGLNVAETQRQSVEAIEVITTYVIDMNEALHAKDAQLKAMQTQLQAMQAQMEAMQEQLNQLDKN